jgi:hypothetical protein
MVGLMRTICEITSVTVPSPGLGEEDTSTHLRVLACGDKLVPVMLYDDPFAIILITITISTYIRLNRTGIRYLGAMIIVAKFWYR